MTAASVARASRPGHGTAPETTRPTRATLKGRPLTLAAPVRPALKPPLRTLKLGQLLATLPDRLTLARQQQLPHADFLELLLSDEVTRRENGSAARRARAAGLDPDMRIDTWDPSAAVRYDQQLWTALVSLRFAEAAHGA